MADQSTQTAEPIANGFTTRNPAIEAILANSELAIEYQFGLACLNRYLTDLALLSSGADYKELGIEERRRASDPALIIQEKGAAVLIEDRGLLRNASMTPQGSVAVLRITGFMQTESSGGSSGVRGMRGLAADLRAAYNNPNVAGVLLEINSGGGELLSFDVVRSALQQRNKPVVSHAYFAASAAYGVAANTDEIVALSEMSRVGSIGVVISVNRAALEKYTAEWLDFYGKGAPNKNGEFRAMQAGDFGPIQRVVDDATELFQNSIQGVRPLRGSEPKIKETLAGGVFQAREAKSRGLVDSIGGLEYALKRLQALTR